MTKPILLIIAAVLLAPAALNVDSPRLNLTAAGLFFWLLAVSLWR